MGYFGAIVRVLGRVVGDTGHDVPMCNSVAAQLVGHETTRFLSLILQEFSEESLRRTPVPTGLDEKVNQVTVLVHGAPQILALTVDAIPTRRPGRIYQMSRESGRRPQKDGPS